MDIKTFEKAESLLRKIKFFENWKKNISRDFNDGLFGLSQTAADRIKKIAEDDIDELLIAAKAEFEAL